MNPDDLIGAIVIDAWGSDYVSYRIYETKKHGKVFFISNKAEQVCYEEAKAPTSWLKDFFETKAGMNRTPWIQLSASQRKARVATGSTIPENQKSINIKGGRFPVPKNNRDEEIN